VHSPPAATPAAHGSGRNVGAVQYRPGVAADRPDQPGRAGREAEQELDKVVGLAREADDDAWGALAAADAAQQTAVVTGSGADEQRAQRAEAHAGEAVEQARLAEQEAVAVAVKTDALLLDQDARKVAAQASEERPFGLPGRPMGRRSPLRHGFSFTVGALLAIALGQALLTVEHELLLVLVSAFIAIGLDPAVGFLVRRGLRRAFAVATIAVLALGAVAGFVAAAVPPITAEATQLVKKAPDYVKQLNDSNSLLGRLNLQFHITERVKQQASGGAVDAAGGLLHAGTVLVSATFETIIVLVLVIYFLADLAQIKAAFYRLFPRHRRPRVGLLGDEVVSRVGGYVLGKLFTSIVALLGNYILLLILHVPYALVLSVLVGLLDLVPLIGGSIAGVIVVLVALATVSGTAAAIAAIYHVIYRIFADYVLNPRVLRRTVDVSPAVTIIAVLIGGSLLGIVGALVAVPVAAAFQLFLTEVVYPQRDAASVADGS
jgi:predicted PurR-regulated permease PerM